MSAIGSGAMTTEEVYGKFTAYDYELLGNEKDGYEVNDVYYRESGVVISKDVWEDPKTRKTLVHLMKKVFLLKRNLRIDSFEFDGEFGYTIYVSYRGIPVGELRNKSTIKI